MNLEKCYQCSGNTEISLDLKVYFSLVTFKINNLIALRSTNQITEISAPWWLSLKDIENPPILNWALGKLGSILVSVNSNILLFSN